MDWPALLGAMIQAKNDIDQRDPEHLEVYTLPRVGAGEADIAGYEQAAGEPLPGGYRDFLAYADGWPSLYFDLDLFGLAELRDGTGSAALATELLDGYQREGVLAGVGWPPVMWSRSVLGRGCGTWCCWCGAAGSTPDRCPGSTVRRSSGTRTSSSTSKR